MNPTNPTAHEQQLERTFETTAQMYVAECLRASACLEAAEAIRVLIDRADWAFEQEGAEWTEYTPAVAAAELESQKTRLEQSAEHHQQWANHWRQGVERIGHQLEYTDDMIEDALAL